VVMAVIRPKLWYILIYNEVIADDDDWIEVGVAVGQGTSG